MYRLKSRRCWPTIRRARLPRLRSSFTRAARPNLFIKIPGTKEGLPAIEEAIFAGIPVNVTLAVLARAVSGGRRGVPARHRAAHRGWTQSHGRFGGIGVYQPLGRGRGGQDPDHLRNQLGIAIAKRIYSRVSICAELATLAARVQFRRASRNVCYGRAPEPRIRKLRTLLYIKGLAAPFTVNTMPEGTLKALANHGELGAALPADGGDSEEVLAQFANAGVDIDAPGRAASG